MILHKPSVYRNTFIWLFILILSVSLPGCTPAKKTTPPPTQAITLNLGGEPTTLDPQLANIVIPMRVINAVFEGLYRKNKNGIPEPASAENCDISNDNLTYTFHLRDTNWSDGTPVQAQDFKNAWLRALDPAPSSYAPSTMGYLLYCIKGAQEYSTGTGKPDDVGIEAKDSKTLVVSLAKPTPYFLELVCNSVYLPLNKAFYEKQTAKDKTLYGTEATSIIGNGPFTVKEWNHNQNIVLNKNETYWNKKAIKLLTINFKIITDASAAFTAFKAGELDMTEITNPEQKEESLKLGNTVLSYNTGAIHFIGFNHKDKVFGNLNIRKALSLALDRNTFIKKVVGDDSEKALGLVPSSIYGNTNSFRTEVGDQFQDNMVDEAKKALSQGLSELNLQQLPVISLLADDTEVARRDIQVFQNMWKEKLGINVEINIMAWDAIESKLMSSDFQIAYLPWGADYNDPLPFLDIFMTDSEYNVYKYSNTAFDKLLEDSSHERDTKRRLQKLAEAEKIAMNDMVICPVYFPKDSYTIKSNIKGIVRGSNMIQNLELYWAYIE